MHAYAETNFVTLLLDSCVILLIWGFFVCVQAVPEKTDVNEEINEEESRPSMDLFKAIFASSSDEKSSSSEEESEEEEQPAALPEPELDTLKHHDESGGLPSKGQGKGLFSFHGFL